jgi:hypothetical protein
MPGLNALYGWLRQPPPVLDPVRHGPSRKPRNPNRGGEPLLLAMGKKTSQRQQVGALPALPLSQYDHAPRAKWERERGREREREGLDML